MANNERPLSIGAFPLGVQYYGAPHTTEADWEQDFARIADHGLRAVKMWAIWGYLEPAPDQYVWDEWERMFDVARRHGLYIVPNTTIEIMPYWIHRVFPDTHLVDEFGQPMLSSPGEYSCGISPGACLDHPGPREQAARFLTAFARHFGDRDNLLAYDAWNEVRWTDNSTDALIRPSVNRVPCYCPATVAGFREWLRARYGSLEALGDTWRRRYCDWADVEPPRGGWWSYAYPDMVDWREYIVEYTLDKLRLRRDALRAGDPRHPVMIHNGGPVIRRVELLAVRGADDWRMAGELDLYGSSLYPGGRDLVEPALNCYAFDGIRSAASASGRRYWMSEFQGGGGFHSPGKGSNYAPADLRLWTHSALAHNAKGILYWSWRPEPFGPETGGFGLALMDGTPTARAGALREMAGYISRHADLLAAAEMPRPEVALLFEPDLHITNWYGGTAGMEGDMARRSLYHYYRALWANDVPCDVVHVDYMGDLERYRLLILPFTFILRASVAQRIQEYVRAGGTVLAEARTGIFRERLQPATTLPTYGLDALFGARETEARFVDAVPLRAEPGVDLFEGLESVQGYYYQEGLEPLPGAEVLARFLDGAPAAVRNRHGSGSATLWGALMSLGYPAAGDGAFERLIGNLCRAAGVRRPVRVQAEGGMVRTRLLTVPEGYLLYCVNYGEACLARLEADLGPVSAARELVTGQAVAVDLAEGVLRTELALPAYDARALLLTRETPKG